MQRRTTFIFKVCCVLCALAHGGCKSKIVIMTAPIVKPKLLKASPDGCKGLYAGACQVDITPPPGLPSLGFSIAAKHKRFKGHQTRLRAYCLVLEDARGERIALVTMDLAWSSTILRWKIAEAVQHCGITVDRILLAGTHTHGGPAGFSSWALFNDQILGPGGYDRELVNFLVKRISEAIVEACRRLEPARLAVLQTLVTDLTENRSRKAHLLNPDVPIGSDGIDPLLTVFRVESRPEKGKPKKPIGAFCVFAGHPTVSGPRRNLWHADVFGVATSKARRLIGQQDKDFVVALANGPEGDVVFRWQHGGAQDHATTVDFGSRLAERIKETWTSAKECDFDPPPLLASRLEQHDLPGAALRSGKMLAREPSAGVAGIGGSEEGYSFLYPVLAREGMRRWFPRSGGDHGAKSAALGPLQPLLLNRKTAPTFAPIQVIRIGEYYLIALPFEVTVQNAVGIRQHVKKELEDTGVDTTEAKILVISAANDYCFYCATAEEYDAQHYEGAYTFYGPNTAQFLAERSANVAVALARGDKQPSLHGFSFPVGQWAQGGHAMPATPTSDPTTERILYLPHSDGHQITMLWWGLPRDRIRIHSGWLVGVREKDKRKIFETKDGDGPENDLGLNFEVELLNQRNRKGLWKVTWHLNDQIPGGTYQFVIAYRPGAPKVSSECFEVLPVKDR